MAWLDTGTHDSLLEAAQFVQTIERARGSKSVARQWPYRQGFIDAVQLERLAQPLAKSGYGGYLLDVLKEQVF